MDKISFKHLVDFESLLKQALSWEQRRQLLQNSGLFRSPDMTKDGQRQHSEILDLLLGFKTVEIEQQLYLTAKERHPAGNVQTWGQSLHQGNQTWVGLHPQTLQTPYTELIQMLELLVPHQSHIVDLGAGYGRMALVLAQVDPASRFTGHELLEERVVEGKRILQELHCHGAELIQQDLMAPSFVIPSADIYFIYDFGKVAHIRHILNQLKTIADTQSFKIIVRGRGARSLIDYEHPWLSQVYPPHHEEMFSIYSMS